MTPNPATLLVLPGLLPNTNPHHEDQSITGLVQTLLMNAVKNNASDIHFEPSSSHCRVRYRLDGILCEMTLLSLVQAMRMTSRIKILANLDIAERRLPQDGSFVFEVEHVKRECRISTCPTLGGEKVVIRLLNSQMIAYPLESLGLNALQSQALLNALKRPHGLILVTGPTGSGKSATLYAALNYLNTIEKNIVTVEDPVEMSLDGINQTTVQPKVGLTFALLLRALLRQDPDVLMIGEIRDAETAKTAVQAALTGHLVLATVHSNTATEAMTRLIEIGIAPIYLASSLTLIVAQRLLRTLCPTCKTIHVPTVLEKGVQGCSLCRQGYLGRTGVFEVMPISPELRQLIRHNATQFDLEEQARNEQILSLYEAALEKLADGLTTRTEINRVMGNMA